MTRWWKPLPFSMAAVILLLIFATLVWDARFYWLHVTVAFIGLSVLVFGAAALVLGVSVVLLRRGAGSRRGWLLMLACGLVWLAALVSVSLNVLVTTAFESHAGSVMVDGRTYHLTLQRLAPHTLMEPLYLEKFDVYACDGSGFWCEVAVHELRVQSAVELRAVAGVAQVVDASGAVVWTSAP